ncbi:MAG: hypothetical protein ACPGXY_02080 [Alphaproteobacteria bacterium]
MMKVSRSTASSNELCRILGQLESHIVTLNNSIVDLKKSLDKVQRRVGTLENKHSYLKGGMGAVWAFFTMIGGLLTSGLHWVFGR